MGRLSAEQKAARRLGIGSSDVAELLGISPYEGASPVRLFAEKTGIVAGDDDDEETLEKTIGHMLEPVLVSLYERESKYKTHTTGPYVETVTHPELTWARANLDARIVDKPAALEVKTVGIGMASDWDLLGDDGIPDYVRVQVAWQMFVAGLSEVHVVALVGGPSGFRVFYVNRDPELEKIIVEAAAAFWNDVRENRVPPLDGSPGTRAYLDAKYPPQAADVEVETRDDMVIEIGDRRLRAEAARKTADEAKAIATAELVEQMGKAGATVMFCDLWHATYRADRNGKRALKINRRGELKTRVRAPKANAKRLPEIVTPDGDPF